MSVRYVWELSRLALADQDGSVIALKAYRDESGGSPVLTVAAYMTRPRQWSDWTKKWNVAKRPIKVIHAVDCANLTGEFKGWSGPDRDAFVANLLPVIARADVPGVVIGIHMGEFEKAMKEHDDLRVLFGTPYAACFQWVVQTIMDFAVGANSRERIAFIHETRVWTHNLIQ